MTDQHGSWSTYRGDRELTGRSNMRGSLVAPRLRWTEYVGAWQTWAVLGTDGNEELGEEYIRNAHERARRRNADWLNLHGDGCYQMIHPAQHRKHARIFENRMCYQLAEATDIPGHARGEAVNGLRLYSYDEPGRPPVLMWEAAFPRYHERPHVLVSDVNGDGEKEIVVSGWEGILVYESSSGRLLMALDQEELHRARKRGFVCARDVDGDGLPEIIVIGMYTAHVNLIQNDGARLSVAWSHMYEDKIEEARRIVRPVLESVQDVDGDGRCEVILNLWNQYGDGRWHVKCVDAQTGQDVFDLPGEYLMDIADIDGDGCGELFCLSADRLARPAFTSISVKKVVNGSPRTIWNSQRAAWVCARQHRHPEWIATHSGDGGLVGDMRVASFDADGSGRRLLLSRRREERFDEVKAESLMEEGSSFCLERDVEIRSFLPLEEEGCPGGSLLLQLASDRKAALTFPGSVFLHQRGTIDKMPSGRINLPIVVDLEGEGQPSIVMRGGTPTIGCYRVDRDGLTQRWRTPGRGMLHQYSPSIDYGCAAVQIRGRRGRSVIIQSDGDAGAALQCLDAQGQVLWMREFPDIQYGEPSGWQGNICFWTPAILTGDGGDDVVVTVQRSIQHTGSTYGLRGTDGAVLWTIGYLTDSGYKSGAGGYPLTAGRAKDARYEHILCGYGNILWCARGSDGAVEFKHFMRGLWKNRWIKDHPQGWVSSLTPIPVEREGELRGYYLAGGENSHGFIDLRGEMLWGNNEICEGLAGQCLLYLRDFGGPLVAEMPVVNGVSRLLLRVPESGEPVPVEPCIVPDRDRASMLVAADLDSDGNDEILVNAGTALACYGYRDGALQRVWSVPFAHRIGPAVVADVDGSGRASVLVSDEKGYLTCLGSD